MFGFPRQSRDSRTTRLFLPARAQTKVPSVQQLGNLLCENSAGIRIKMKFLNLKKYLLYFAKIPGTQLPSEADLCCLSTFFI